MRVSQKQHELQLTNLELGCYGEAVASEYLCRKGYQVIAHNVKNKRGEIDILVVQDAKSIKQGDSATRACNGAQSTPAFSAAGTRRTPVDIEPILAAVEVKTRRSMTYGFPREAVNHTKQMHIRQTLLWYLSSHPQWSTYRIRFDVIEVYVAANGKATVKHWPGCFE